MIDFQEIGLGERDIEKSEGSAKLRTLFSLAQTLGYDELVAFDVVKYFVVTR